MTPNDGPRRQWRRLGIAPALLLAVIGALALLARHGASPVAAACDGSTIWQQDSMVRVKSWYMHIWLEDFGDNSCVNTQYVYGGDSRSSWGGSWHNVSDFSVSGRAWVCGGLRESDALSETDSAYIQFSSQAFNYHNPNGNSWDTCGHQADTNGHYSVPNQFKWDTYISLDHNTHGWTHQ